VQFNAARNGKPACFTKEFAGKVPEIEHHDVAGSGITADKFCDKHARKWTTQALITLEEGMEVYIVEVIAETHY
jgi:hypothetical protein